MGEAVFERLNSTNQPYSVVIPYSRHAAAFEWCNENISDDENDDLWYVIMGLDSVFRFKHEKDAILFTLRWV